MQYSCIGTLNFIECTHEHVIVSGVLLSQKLNLIYKKKIDLILILYILIKKKNESF